MSQAIGKLLTASWWVAAGQMNLKWEDPTYNRSGDREIAGVQGSGIFNYLPALMNQVLRNIPGDDVVFYQAKEKYYLSDLAHTYTALIMECAAAVAEGDKKK